MKKLLFILLLLASVFAFGQDEKITYTKPYASFGVEIAGQYGYEVPVYTFGGGVESLTNHLRVNVGGGFALARKIETGDGHAYDAGGSLGWRFKNTYVGGGAQYSKQITSSWSKQRTQPFGYVMYDHEKFRVQGVYQAGFDKRNGNKEISGTIEYKFGPHFSLYEVIGGSWFHATDEPEVKASGRFFSCGVKWLF